MAIKYRIIYAPETSEHLAWIERRYYTLIKTTIVEQLSFTPDSPTRNRKPLNQPAPFDAMWELRFGNRNRWRVFYEVSGSEVIILAIGEKRGNVLFVGREEFRP